MKKKSAGVRRSKAKEDLVVPSDEKSAAFVRDLVQRGEAVRPKPGSPLPSTATHEIVGETADGQPILRRNKFTAF